MPDPATTRLALYKSASDGSEAVNYTQDIGQNWDRVDAAVGFQAVTSSTRPSSPYSGKPIMETDTSYRTYFSNGTSPASASWVEIPNSSGTFGGDLKLASGKQVNINTSGSTASYTALHAATSTAFISTRVTGDTQNRYLQTADGGMAWGPGNASTDVTLARTGTGRLTITGTNAALTIGTATIRSALATAAGVTVANTTTETVVGTFTIPASDAVAGAIYRARVVANVSFLASAQLTWRARLGGVSGTLLAAAGPTTLSGTGQTNKESCVDASLVCAATGASGTWFALLQEIRNTTQTGAVGDVQLGSSDGTVTRDTTVSNDFVLTAQWAAASASNTLTARVIFERVA